MIASIPDDGPEDVAIVVFPAVVVVVVVLASTAGVTMLVDTKIITIARTEIVIAVAMGWLLLLFLLFRCIIFLSFPNMNTG